MKFIWHICLLFVISIAIKSTLAARRLAFRPLSGQEVYRILKDAGREDAIPKGRVITEGISAITGFALGLKKGIAIPLAVDLTANETHELINKIDLTAIGNLLPTIPTIKLPTIDYEAIIKNIPSFTLPKFTLPTFDVTSLKKLLKKSSDGKVEYTTQEICFKSRSLNENDDEDDENDDDNVDEAELAVSESRQAEMPTAATGTQADTGIDTSSDADDGTGTDTESTTQTDTRKSINCIVLQKPKPKS